MLVTQIEHSKGKQYQIYLDGVYAFWLYGSELRQLGIEKSSKISEEEYNRILWETVFSHAKRKAMNLLLHMDRSKEELRLRLSKEFYPALVVEQTMEYIEGFHYIDDLRYALGYIRLKSSSKSKAQIQYSLRTKGIDDSTIEEAYSQYQEEENEDPELDAVMKFLKRKNFDQRTTLKEEELKLCASLQRKGFQTGTILKAISCYQKILLQEDLES